MKNLFLVMLLALFAFTSCSKDGGGDDKAPLVLTGGTTTTQTVYADQTSGSDSGIKFAASAPWTATVSAIAGKAGGSDLDWLTLNTYNGGAGEYTLIMTLTENTTGADRKAQISIVCGGMTITITVEQKGTTAEGEKPKVPKLVSKILLIPDSKEDASEITFTYYPDNRVKTIVWGKKGSDRATTQTYTYLGNKITEITKDQSVIDETIYTLNNDGYIIDYACDGKEKGTFTYSNGYLTEIIYKNTDKDKYVWENGNLKSSQTINFEDATVIGTLYTYQYGDELNNCSGNIDIARVLNEDPDFWAFDYFGKRTKNLPIKEIGSMDQWDKNNGTHTYRYEKNKEGNITKIYATYQPEGGSVEPEFLIYEIQYK